MAWAMSGPHRPSMEPNALVDWLLEDILPDDEPGSLSLAAVGITNAMQTAHANEEPIARPDPDVIEVLQRLASAGRLTEEHLRQALEVHCAVYEMAHQQFSQLIDQLEGRDE